MKHALSSLLKFTPAALLLSACSQLPIVPVEKVEFSDTAKKAFEQYQKTEGKKAFAVSSNGAYGFSGKQSSNDTALRIALKNCQNRAAIPCRISHLNDEMFDPKYQNYANASRNALAKLNAEGNQYKIIESMDWHIPTPTQLRSVEDGVHFPTPLHLNGINTLQTDALVEKIKSDNLLLIDARYISGNPDPSLPNAYLFDFAGVAYSDEARDKKISLAIDKMMQKIAPDKAQPIAVFCTSVECWLSVNTVMRLQNLGYTNLFWYRGGIQAWAVAK
nr:rhodanese-like domain-containing protein [uncultured Undibacterium sp.]